MDYRGASMLLAESEDRLKAKDDVIQHYRTEIELLKEKIRHLQDFVTEFDEWFASSRLIRKRIIEDREYLRRTIQW